MKTYQGLAQTTDHVLARHRVRLLEGLVLAHIFIVAFEIPLRSMIINSTFWRDGLLVALVGLVLLGVGRDKIAAHKQGFNLLDRLFALYLLYGVSIGFIASMSGLGLLESVLGFRNFFLPATLYFVARKAFRSSEALGRLVKLCMFVAAVYILDVLMEFGASQLGLRTSNLPWYRFTFRFSDRFVGNELGSPGYVHTEDSPVLGLLGWPHYTAATLMAMAAFSFPFLRERGLKKILSGGRSFGSGLSVWLRRSIGPLAIVAVIILGVKTHLVAAGFVFLILPLFVQRKVLPGNVVMAMLSLIILWGGGYLSVDYVDRLRGGFIGSGQDESTFAGIFSFHEQEYFQSAPLMSVIFGIGDINSSVFGQEGEFEFKLLQFTAAFGIIWLILFLGVYITGFVFARRVALHQREHPVVRLFGIGTIGLLSVFLIDTGHYARTMYFPNIDIWCVCLGVISAKVNSQRAILHRLREFDQWQRNSCGKANTVSTTSDKQT